MPKPTSRDEKIAEADMQRAPENNIRDAVATFMGRTGHAPKSITADVTIIDAQYQAAHDRVRVVV